MKTLRELYLGESDRAHRFRYALLGFDMATITYVVATSFSSYGPVIQTVDAVFGLVILGDFAARLAISQNRMRHLARLSTLADIVAIFSFLAPLFGEGLGFLRVLRTLRLLHTYQLSRRLRRDFRFFRRHEDVVLAVVDLSVFIFVMTGLVHAAQNQFNPQIGNFADALYFTVTALTTTGFGDITPEGTLGRMISVVVMIFGVTLFLRLAQVLFRSKKVRQPCQTCGLVLHDVDAIHCKHCGDSIRIETEGVT